jgi:hypothetical protein
MLLARSLIGAALLAFGRKLFWLFVAGVGFIVGLNLATSYLRGSPQWLILLLALLAGLIGALLAVFAQSIAIGIAGFVAGGYILVTLLGLIGFNPNQFSWLLYLVGGIIGAVLAYVVFDWALIILSSLAGAAMITEAFHLAGTTGFLAYAGLLIVGILIQASMLRSDRHRRG